MILQVCLGLAELGPEFPPKGVIPASKGGKKLLLDLEVSDIHSFQLWWPKSFASDQASNPDFPNEEIHSGAKKTA
ncbi:MAG: hypothetical protein HY287_10690 [Planctomycetes bacterium]|nr:hypothetical protein [Planctomycetota bacterium]MBI3834785.1 hypothetical protein [Planctomycetota bacterium]